ncbi:3,4-dihydroxy-2-butanone 4-phosphate synthase [uncultured archaeon]|nr:3,4-dihydroxy-2-butanone 4-phosphate synthase [uncultured archaeon]
MTLQAIRALAEGKAILLYDFDDREKETDLVIAAEFITPRIVYQMRKDAGGLICVAIDPLACRRLGLPYFSDILMEAAGSGKTLPALELVSEKAGDIPYDVRSSFSLWVNHRKTYTGITDADRSLTIRELAAITAESLKDSKIKFGDRFRSPGHVPLLRTAPGLLRDRRGQTELSMVLAKAAGVIPATVVCEMLNGETGQALSKGDAMSYAAANGLAFVEGRDVEALFRGTIISDQDSN